MKHIQTKRLHRHASHASVQQQGVYGHSHAVLPYKLLITSMMVPQKAAIKCQHRNMRGVRVDDLRTTRITISITDILILPEVPADWCLEFAHRFALQVS